MGRVPTPFHVALQSSGWSHDTLCARLAISLEAQPHGELAHHSQPAWGPPFPQPPRAEAGQRPPGRRADRRLTWAEWARLHMPHIPTAGCTSLGKIGARPKQAAFPGRHSRPRGCCETCILG